MAGPWCNVIAGTGYIKFANDESLARDEGGGHNLFMEVVTYKTVQGRRLRRTPATANHFFPSVDAAVCRTAELRRGAWGRLRRPSRKKNHKAPWVTASRPDRQLRHPKGVWGSAIQVQVTTML